MSSAQPPPRFTLRQLHARVIVVLLAWQHKDTAGVIITDPQQIAYRYCTCARRATIPPVTLPAAIVFLNLTMGRNTLYDILHECEIIHYNAFPTPKAKNHSLRSHDVQSNWRISLWELNVCDQYAGSTRKAHE